MTCPGCEDLKARLLHTHRAREKSEVDLRDLCSDLWTYFERKMLVQTLGDRVMRDHRHLLAAMKDDYK